MLIPHTPKPPPGGFLCWSQSNVPTVLSGDVGGRPKRVSSGGLDQAADHLGVAWSAAVDYQPALTLPEVL